MYKSNTVKNFQSYKNVKFDFSPHINVIVGPSDSGKTVLIRVLEWIRNNRPSGQEFRSHWGGSTSAELELGSGDVITRKRTDKENLYLLNDDKYAAVKTDVPEEIKGMLNMGDVNVQGQLDRPFLLDETPGTVAKHFNRVANLDKIDTSLSNISGWIRNLESELDFSRGRKEKLEQDLQEFDHLNDLEKKLKKVERLDKYKNDQGVKYRRLQSTVHDYIAVKKEIERLEPITTLESKVNKSIEIRGRHSRLKTLISTITNVETEMEELRELSKCESVLNELDELRKKNNEAQDKYDDLNHLIDNIDSVDREIQTQEDYLKVFEHEFHENMPDECPLCGRSG